MRCPNCGQEMICRQGEHHYTESGLSQVYLTDVELWSCSCGEEAVGIPAVPELHRVIGEDLLRKPAMLTGEEIRFLRKNMGMASKALASILGVDPATVSRWENEKQAPDPTTERFIRMIYAAKKGIAQAWLLEKLPEIKKEQTAPLSMRLLRAIWSRGQIDAEACAR